MSSANDDPISVVITEPTNTCTSPNSSPQSSSSSATGLEVTKDQVSTSPGAVCRICLSNEEKSNANELISPCHCYGTVSKIHRHCLEKWLTIRNNSLCELCQTEVPCRLAKPGLTRFIRSSPSSRPLVTDVACFVFLTPLVILAAVYCLGVASFSGVVNVHQPWKRSTVDMPLLCLGFFLIVIYLIWACITAKHHYFVYKRWRNENRSIKLVWPKKNSFWTRLTRRSNQKK